MTRRTAPRIALAGVLLFVVALTGCKSDTPKAVATAVVFKVTPLDALKSYRFDSNVFVSSEALDPQMAAALLQGGTFRVKASGTRVNPDSQQSKLDADLGFLKVNIETINIGKEQWSREPAGAWQKGIGGPAALLATSDFSPQGLISGMTGREAEQLTQRLEGRTFTKDVSGGVAARHYVFDRKAFEEVFGTQSAVPESAADVQTQADVWFAEERGVLLRVLITGKNAQQKEVLKVDVQVADIDAGVEIKAPI